jgi:hypothetical protein
MWLVTYLVLTGQVPSVQGRGTWRRAFDRKMRKFFWSLSSYLDEPLAFVPGRKPLRYVQTIDVKMVVFWCTQVA